MVGYRPITDTNLDGDSAAYLEGNAVTFAGSNKKTLGFYGADLGSAAPSEGRVPAFLGLAERTGGVYIENPPSVTEALRQTGLDFEVRKDSIAAFRSEDVMVVGDDGQPQMIRQDTDERLPMPTFTATVAYPKDGGQPFAIAPVSPRYTVIQNDTALEIGDAVSEGRLVALGAFGRPTGARVYAAWQLAEDLVIGGGDPYRNYVTIITTHDGTGTWGQLAPIRLGCTNQTNATFGRGAVPRFTVRHVGELKFRLEEARRILSLSKQYLDVLAEESENLLATPMSKDKFVVYAKQVWAVKDEADLGKKSKTIVQVRQDQLLQILDSQTCEFGRGTAYAGYQAVVEYMDFFGRVRGADDANARRQERIMAGELDAAKTRAFSLAAALA